MPDQPTSKAITKTSLPSDDTELNYYFENEARYFFNYLYGIHLDEELDDVHLFKKKFVMSFGRYLQKEQIAIPVKGDAIQFLYLSRKKYSLTQLVMGLDIMNEFIKYCHKHIKSICESDYYQRKVSRHIQFTVDKIPFISHQSVKDAPDLDELIKDLERLGVKAGE